MNLADRIAPLRLLLIGALGAAGANAVIAFVDDFGSAVVLRFVTGAFLAAVYPPALKAMSSWYRAGRGFALGVMIGALTIGSALPHLVNGIGGLDWQATLLIASGLTVVGGLVADRACSPGPYTVATARFDPSQLRAIVANREFRLASAGYFGHMWELYAMWAWMAAFYTDALDSGRAASFAAFAVIGIGAAGSVYAGRLSDRRSRAAAAALAMRWSASVALVIGFLVEAPSPLVIGVGLVWGFWVVADSAQFSTIVTEVTDAALCRHGAHGAAGHRVRAHRVHDLPRAGRARRVRLGLGLPHARPGPDAGRVGHACPPSGPEAGVDRRAQLDVGRSVGVMPVRGFGQLIAVASQILLTFGWSHRACDIGLGQFEQLVDVERVDCDRVTVGDVHPRLGRVERCTRCRLRNWERRKEVTGRCVPHLDRLGVADGRDE